MSFELLIAGDVEQNPGDGVDNLETTQVKLPDKGLRIWEWNVQHLIDSKFEQISLILGTCNNIDVLFLLETFLKPSKPDSEYSIPGYNLYRKDRYGSKAGGGLLAYIADRVKAKRRCELEDDFVESRWFDVCPHGSNRPILVGALYHPPSVNVDADLKIEHHIESVYLKSKEMIQVGDLNINYLDQSVYSKHRLAKVIKSLNVTQHVTVVTRPSSKSCLDHVYATNSSFISNIVVPDIGLSDHFPVFVCRKYFKHNKDSTHKTINYSDYKNVDTDALIAKYLENTPWDSAFVFDDVDDIIETLQLLLNQVLNEYIPVKQKRVRKVKQPDWFNDRIINAIKTRDKELKKARKSNDPDDWTKYRRSKCFVTNLIRKFKRLYFQQSIDNNKGNPKGIWKALKSLTKSNKQSRITELRRDDSTTETDTLAMANMLNEFFVNIASGLSPNSTPSELDTSRLESFVSSKLDHLDTQFNIPAITEQDTMRMIHNLSSRKGTGSDGISVKILKLAAPVLCQPLTRFFYLSLEEGCLPRKWKVARVTPLHKDDVRDNEDNYRPVSVLSVLSKLIEKHVARSLMNYLVQNGLLYHLQSAFREGYSTESALINLTDKILFNLDQDEVTGMVFVDIRKAFDVIDHHVLLKKLEL